MSYRNKLGCGSTCISHQGVMTPTIRNVKRSPPSLRPSESSRRTQKNSSSFVFVNTNLSAHPRTDPVNALNVLLKVLTSLPSRIGGCQFKLTQAEHALSLHLISILDPFIYHGVRALASNKSKASISSPTFFGLVHQPTEILDQILFHVDAKKDLLNLGLSCKRLHDNVFPRHFEYRVIRCKVSTISVWNHLVVHRSLARNVRKLEITDERASAAILIPRGILHGDTDLESTDDELTMHVKQEHFLSAALLRMTGLKEFEWSSNHSPISIANVWPALISRSVHLRAMEICDNLVFAPRNDNEDEDDAGSEPDSESEGVVATTRSDNSMTRMPSTSLTQMQSVVFRSSPLSYGASKYPELNRISSMLHHCVNIKHLELSYTPPRSSAVSNIQGTPSRMRPLADEFLTYGRWPKLATLTLSNLRCTSFTQCSNFLSAHSALEVLHLDVNFHTSALSMPIFLNDGALPRLHEIKAARDIVNAILECPCEGRRPLETIKGFKLSGSSSVNPNNPSNSNSPSPRFISDSVFLSNLQQVGNNIRRVELHGWHDMEEIRKLIACIPKVQYLDIGRRLGATAQRNNNNGSVQDKEKNGTTGPATNMAEWAELLSVLPELTTMHGVRFFYEVSSATAAGASSSSNFSSGPGSSSNAQAPTRDFCPSLVRGSTMPLSKPQSSTSLSMMERSRLKKNDEIAGVLSWKCGKLRRVDHWEAGSGKVIILLRDRDHGHGAGEDGGNEKERENKVRWEVRRVMKH